MPTPRDTGFRLPAEWTPHTRCWMAWPLKRSVWGDRLKAAQTAFAEVASTIADFEPVTMIARSSAMTDASLMLGKGVSVLPLDHDDAWARDTGPAFVVNDAGAVAGVDFRFDGWGEKGEGFEVDCGLPARILDHLKLQRFTAPLVFEGGAVQVDGEGTALVCAGSALDERRNPGVTREAVEAMLRDFLGVETTIWLDHGLIDDDTGGHVDNLACFVRPGAVMTLLSSERSDPDQAGLQENLARLRSARDAKGRELEVIEVLRPPQRLRDDGRRLTRSYLNFYVANGGVVMPVFEESTDDAAIRLVRHAFPGREIAPLVANDIVVGGGGIHCITQQQPAPLAQAPVGDDAEASAAK